MTKKTVFSLLLLGLFLFASPLVAGEPDPEQLAREAFEASYFPGEDVRWKVEMEILDDRDRLRTRELTVLRKNTGDNRQKYYSYFHNPAQLQRMVFLVWTEPQDDDDRWLYMPAVDMVQRISGRQKRNSFAGSDFTYEDMTGRYPEQDQFQYIGSDELDGRPVEIIRGEPREPDLVEFSFYRMYIDTATKLALKGEFYNPQGELHRTLELLEFEEIDGYPTPLSQRATNQSTGSTTTNTMSDIEYNIGLPENLFEERYLRRPPTPWVQP